MFCIGGKGLERETERERERERIIKSSYKGPLSTAR